MRARRGSDRRPGTAGRAPASPASRVDAPPRAAIARLLGGTLLGDMLLAGALLGSAPLEAQSAGDAGDAGDAPREARASDRGPGPLLHDTTLLHSDTALPGGAWLRAEPASRSSPWITRGAGFVMLVATDVGLRRAVQDSREGPGPLSRHGSVGDEVAEFGNGLGAWKTSLPWLAAGSVAVGAAADGLRGAGRGLSVLGGIAAGTMTNEALNQAVGRSRPAWDEGVLSFDPFSGHASFPSGHVSLAFSMAGGVDAVTDGWLPATAAYTVAGTTAFARVYSDSHWLSDVVVGAALSATVSRLATRRTMELLGVARDDGPEEDASRVGTGSGRSQTAENPGRPLRARLLFTPALLGVELRF